MILLNSHRDTHLPLSRAHELKHRLNEESILHHIFHGYVLSLRSRKRDVFLSPSEKNRRQHHKKVLHHLSHPTKAVGGIMLHEKGRLFERTNRGLLHTIELIKEALLVQRFTEEL